MSTYHGMGGLGTAEDSAGLLGTVQIARTMLLKLLVLLSVCRCRLLQHMMESLKKQGAVGGGGGGSGGVLGSTLGTLGGLGGGLTGMAAGMAAGMLASFVLGPGAMGGQVPVLSCDKQVDIHQMRLAI